MDFNKILQIIPYEEATKRIVEEEPNKDQSPFLVDEGRIIFNVFNRLENITQVILTSGKFCGNAINKIYKARSRCSHSIEVKYTAQRIADYIGINKELAGVISLAHDTGHAPFGHSGEKTLDEIMKDNHEIGFDHDMQAIRLVTKLIKRDKRYDGLNLTNQVVNDLTARAKRHSAKNDSKTSREKYPSGKISLEGQICEFSDKLTFIIHDIEDAIMKGVCNLDFFYQQPFLKQNIDEVGKKLTYDLELRN